MIRGSCHCGSVTFEITGEVSGFKHCHCQTCRKINGTVYGSSALTDRSGFKVTKGEEDIIKYESSPGKHRCFCMHCGSHVFAYYDENPDVVVLRVGTLDDPIGIVPECHIWVSQKAKWHRIRDNLPQWDKD